MYCTCNTSSAGVMAKSLKRYHWKWPGICSNIPGVNLQCIYISCTDQTKHLQLQSRVCYLFSDVVERRDSDVSNQVTWNLHPSLIHMSNHHAEFIHRTLLCQCRDKYTISHSLLYVERTDLAVDNRLLSL